MKGLSNHFNQILSNAPNMPLSRPRSVLRITPYVNAARDHLTAKNIGGVQNKKKDMGMSDMFAWKNSNWATKGNANAVLPELDAQTSGLVAGTKVATKSGWAPVETIQTGQKVLTFDGGFQTVIAVTRHVLIANTNDAAAYPMTVPSGALGNLEVMTILPHQPVMIESDMAEEMTGDPFALIPASTLGGVRGIIQARPSSHIEVIELYFAQDEIVFANIGALFLCRKKADLMSDMGTTDYEVLPIETARDLTDCLAAEGKNASRSTTSTATAARG